MEKVTDQEIREHFLSASPDSKVESDVRNCLARAATGLNNMLPDGVAKGDALHALDGSLTCSLRALEPDVAQPDTQTDPPQPTSSDNEPQV